MATENTIQNFIHKLEEGGWAKWIQIILIVAAFSGVSVKILFFNFRGLADAKGMDQAQIAREVARGNGFSTKVLKPLALWQFEKNVGAFPAPHVPDTYHAPLGPAVNALPLWLTGSMEPMSPNTPAYRPDQMITGLALLFFLLGVWLSFLALRLIFDARVAWITTALLMVCADYYELAQTGLPQMLMFLIFSGCILTLAKAVEAFHAGRGPTLWLSASGLLFGLLALAHYLTVWIFAGVLVFVALAFRPRGRDAGIMAALFLLVASPWLVRNYSVSGNPLGIAGYTLLVNAPASESAMMRNLDVAPEVSLSEIRRKVQREVVSQLTNLYGNLGSCVAAPVFFLALLHRFKRPESASLLWCGLLMVAGAVTGMAIAGLGGLNSMANNLYVLLIPLMAGYGVAFLLVLWGRAGLQGPLLRNAFVALVIVLSAFPFAVQLLAPKGIPYQWPPYAPPIIGLLSTWTTEDEVIASDQPWAVAWYADRRSMWLPLQIEDFIEMHDFARYGRVKGLYLTPVSSDSRFVSDIQLGEWKEWGTLVMKTIDPSKFVLPAVVPLWQDAQLLYFTDTPRWKNDSQ